MSTKAGQGHRLILCFGYDRDPKKRLPFRRIAERMQSPTLTPIEKDGHRFGVWAKGHLPVAEAQTLPVALVAVYHPSARNHASWSDERLALFVDEVAPQLRTELG